MRSYEEMIDRAEQICGNGTRVAERLEISRQRWSEYKTGKRRITERFATEFAAVIGEQPRHVIGAAGEFYWRKKKEAALAGIAAAAFTLVALLGATPSTSQAATNRQAADFSVHGVHIMRNRRRVLATLFRILFQLAKLGRTLQPHPSRADRQACA